jgi:uncharacterized protein YbjT (DUF2867 family)
MLGPIDANASLGRLLYEMLAGGRCMAKVLVTGGNIGNYVAEGLGTKGVPVRVLVRRVSPNKRWQEFGIEQIAGDVANVDSLVPAFDNVDRFFSVTPFVENLVELGQNAIAAARTAGVRYIVRSSAMGASETAITMGRWHREVEKALEASGITFTILQPNTFMQSYLMNVESIKQRSAFYLPQGDGRVSLVDVRDIAAVAVACLTEDGHQGKKYVLTGGEALSNAEIAQKVTEVLGTQICYRDVSPKQAENSMTSSGMPRWMVQCFLELFEISKAGYVAEISPIVEQVLKRKPISFDQFLRDNREYFRVE